MSSIDYNDVPNTQREGWCGPGAEKHHLACIESPIYVVIDLQPSGERVSRPRLYSKNITTLLIQGLLPPGLRPGGEGEKKWLCFSTWFQLAQTHHPMEKLACRRLEIFKHNLRRIVFKAEPLGPDVARITRVHFCLLSPTNWISILCRFAKSRIDSTSISRRYRLQQEI